MVTFAFSVESTASGLNFLDLPHFFIFLKAPLQNSKQLHSVRITRVQVVSLVASLTYQCR